MIGLDGIAYIVTADDAIGAELPAGFLAIMYTV
jgi:hypothetical protein